MASLLSNLFGSGAAGEAADKNAKLFNQYQDTGVNILDDSLINAGNAVRTGAGQANAALDANRGVYGDYGTIARGALDSGLTNGVNALNGAAAGYGSLSDLAGKYGQGTNLYLDSLGANGAEGNARAQSAFQAGPGYDFTLGQGLQALQRTRNAQGMLNSGNTDIDTLKYATGLANQTYGSWQDRLAGLVNPELSATSGAATGQAGVANSLASLYGTYGQNQAGVANNVATGLAGVNTGQAANDVALGNSLATLQGNDTTNRLGVVGNSVSGVAQSNNQKALAEMSGAKNLLGLGTSLLGLGTGGGGTLGGNLLGSFLK
jgi:hypothetical protein